MAGAERPADTLVTVPRGLMADSRAMLMAGVASACLLGAAAGAWVRPETDDLKAREAVRTVARTPPPTAAPQMRIVMDAEMLPARPPLDVLPAGPPRAVVPQPPATVIAPPLEQPPSLRLARDEASAPSPPRSGSPKPRTVESPKPAKTGLIKAEAKPSKPTRPDKTLLAKAERKPEAETAKLARAEKTKKTKDPKPAKAEAARKAKAVKLAKAEAVKKKAKKIELAKAEKASKPPKAKPEKAAMAKSEPKSKPPQKPKPKSMAVLLAEIERLKSKPTDAPPVKLAAAKPVPPPKPEPQARIAKATAKAPAPKTPPRSVQQARRQENPWAEEDRRLARAYRRAAEAGVPAWRLERQQARWRLARDAAEREAPWAVSDVYDARIAELDDLAGEAAMEWN